MENTGITLAEGLLRYNLDRAVFRDSNGGLYQVNHTRPGSEVIRAYDTDYITFFCALPLGGREGHDEILSHHLSDPLDHYIEPIEPLSKKELIVGRKLSDCLQTEDLTNFVFRDSYKAELVKKSHEIKSDEERDEEKRNEKCDEIDDLYCVSGIRAGRDKKGNITKTTMIDRRTLDGKLSDSILSFRLNDETAGRLGETVDESELSEKGGIYLETTTAINGWQAENSDRTFRRLDDLDSIRGIMGINLEGSYYDNNDFVAVIVNGRDTVGASGICKADGRTESYHGVYPDDRNDRLIMNAMKGEYVILQPIKHGLSRRLRIYPKLSMPCRKYL